MIFENYETAWLEKIDSVLSPISEMKREEREFVNGLVRYHKPKKILEVGVSAGASSAILLNASADYGAEVHSIEYLDHWYLDPSKESGFLIKEKFPELASNWSFHHGAIAAQFMEKIGGNIDLCLLDTMHCNPGEFLDFLMILPYLRSDAIIILHDVALHTLVGNFDTIPDTNTYDKLTTCGALFSALRGQRLLPSRMDSNYRFANIGAIKLTEGMEQDLWPFFNLLTLPWINWSYLNEKDWELLSNFITRHYPADMQIFFQKIIEYKNMRKTFKINKNSMFPAHHKKHRPLKQVANFVKSYFLFPWYVRKIYKKVCSKNL